MIIKLLNVEEQKCVVELGANDLGTLRNLLFNAIMNRIEDTSVEDRQLYAKLCLAKDLVTYGKIDGFTIAEIAYYHGEGKVLRQMQDIKEMLAEKDGAEQ